MIQASEFGQNIQKEGLFDSLIRLGHIHFQAKEPKIQAYRVVLALEGVDKITMDVSTMNNN